MAVCSQQTRLRNGRNNKRATPYRPGVASTGLLLMAGGQPPAASMYP